MLELRNITKLYRGVTAVENVSFCVQPGEVTGYLGANGSGKSTTMKMIMGLLEPTSGQVLYAGRPVQEDWMAHRERIGYVPEEPYLYTHLSGLEYLEMVADLRDLPRAEAKERMEGLLRLFGLGEDRHALISGYSKGMRQKVLLSAALLHNPEVVLLDEPFSGLDVGSSLVLRSLILELAARGKAVLLSSHELDVVEKLCQRVVILHKGRMVGHDSIARLRDLMSAPSLENVFAQLAIEQDTEAISKDIANLIGA